MARPESRSPVPDRMSGSPQPQHLSKRDKRRTMLADKLTDMVSAFSSNLRPHYEAQTNAIQVDISMIMRTNPYENKPLTDDPEKIAEQIAQVVGNNRPAEPVAEDDFVAGVGKRYTDFVHKINNSMEERDVNLTVVANKFENGRSELEQRHQFHVKLADEEHKNLADTLRQRLLGQVLNKRNKLLKEKEHLDIGDSSALLLHPNQFGLVNPASPGGAHKRATRNTGRRTAADPDDSGTLGVGEKRKRKPLFDEYAEGQSPVAGPSRPEMPTGSPWRDAKSRTINHQFEAQLYSIDRLFTEKELSMNMNLAATAAQNFLMKLKNNSSTSTSAPNGSAAPTNGKQTADADIQMLNAPPPETDTADDDATPAAPEMDRSVSQSYHQTRNATRSALSDLAAVAASSSQNVPRGVALPTFIPAALGSKANGANVSAAPLTQAEVDADLRLMADSSGTQFINMPVRVQGAAEYVYRAPSLLPDTQGGDAAGFGALAFAAGMLGGANGGGSGASSVVGGEAMSRVGSAVGMKRTVSGTGSLLGVGEGGRRVRARVG